MPIKPENKSKYPDNWKEIRETILNRARNKCEICGVRNHRIGFRNKTGRFRTLDKRKHSKNDYITVINDDNETVRVKTIMIVLTIMHLDHNPENNDPKNLKAGCQKCHNSYDKEHRAKNRSKTIKKRKEKPVKIKYIKCHECGGQGLLENGKVCDVCNGRTKIKEYKV